MNTTVFEQTTLNSEHNQAQKIGRETKLMDTNLQASDLIDANANSKGATFNLSTYLSQQQAQVEAALKRLIIVAYPEILYESKRYS